MQAACPGAWGCRECPALIDHGAESAVLCTVGRTRVLLRDAHIAFGHRDCVCSSLLFVMAALRVLMLCAFCIGSIVSLQAARQHLLALQLPEHSGHIQAMPMSLCAFGPVSVVMPHRPADHRWLRNASPGHPLGPSSF